MACVGQPTRVKLVWFVDASRIACNGLCTAARFRTAEEKPRMPSGCVTKGSIAFGTAIDAPPYSIHYVPSGLAPAIPCRKPTKNVFVADALVALEPTAKPKPTSVEDHRNPHPRGKSVGHCEEEDQDLSPNVPLGTIDLESFLRCCQTTATPRKTTLEGSCLATSKWNHP